MIGAVDINLKHLDKMSYLNGALFIYFATYVLLMLVYILAVMRETLRLSPTAPARVTSAREDIEIIGGNGDPSNPANKKIRDQKGRAGRRARSYDSD